MFSFNQLEKSQFEKKIGDKLDIKYLTLTPKT